MYNNLDNDCKFAFCCRQNEYPSFLTHDCADIYSVPNYYDVIVMFFLLYNRIFDLSFYVLIIMSVKEICRGVAYVIE